MNNETRALFSSIKSDFLKSRIEELNDYFYNRKHEGQIRDSILIEINKRQELLALSEYPKNKNAAVDLSLYDGERNVAIVEFKHHYGKDLNLKRDIDAIIKDMTRYITDQNSGKEYRTTHFVLIVQERLNLEDFEKTTLENTLKFKERNSPYSNTILSKLESDNRFPVSIDLKHDRHIHEVVIDCSLKSKYTFVLYEI